MTSHSVLVKTFRRRNLLHRAAAAVLHAVLRVQTTNQDCAAATRCQCQDVCHREGINNVAEASGFYNKCLICNFVTTQINAGSKHYSYQPVTRSATQTTRSNRSKQNHWRKTAAAHWVLVFLLILLSLPSITGHASLMTWTWWVRIRQCCSECCTEHWPG